MQASLLSPCFLVVNAGIALVTLLSCGQCRHRSCHLAFLWSMQAQEVSLQRYVNESMPSTHPMFQVVSQSLQMLQHNPNWNHQKKAQYMWRLIHDLR